MRVEKTINAASSLRVISNVITAIGVFGGIVIALVGFSEGEHAAIPALGTAIPIILSSILLKSVCSVLANISDSLLVISAPNAEMALKLKNAASEVPSPERKYPASQITIQKEDTGYYAVIVTPSGDEPAIRKVFSSDFGARKYAEEITEDEDQLQISAEERSEE